MPYARATVKVAEPSWDSFEAPTPEASCWQPDPDSVPIAGGLPDPRFNKDPLEARQKQALKREKLFGCSADMFIDDRSAVLATSCNPDSVASTGSGGWPTPVARAAAFGVAASQIMPVEALRTKEASMTKKAYLTFAEQFPKPTSDFISSTFTDGIKGGMEFCTMQPSFARPPTPPASTLSDHTDRTHKASPAWARQIEHLLGDCSAPRALTPRPAQPQAEPAAQPAISTPPHLRKLKQELRTTSIQASLKPKSPTSKAGDRTTDVFEQSEGLVLESKSESSKAATDVQHQKRLLDSLIPKKVVPSHERYLHIKLISIMEDEIDLEKRTTRQDLCTMDDKTFKHHFDRIVAMHKIIWNTKQVRDEIEEMI